ncbi:MAG: tRNA (adenosine(37)-N6)-threonylcarbamoyltransferase complex transferase subunit TsaD [bacterium]
MLILGIETSCDETSVALVANGQKVLEHIVSSQIKLHSRFSGIVPEIASRAHLESINLMLEDVLRKKYYRNKIDAVAVTHEPGLIGSILIGLITAEVISYVLNLPLIKVNHLEGHIFSSFIGSKLPSFPFISLVVSGGHTDLTLVKGFGRYEIIGRTRDDACGEAYDKVARVLGFGYPGGPIIDALYKKSNPDEFPLPRIVMPESFDFSFSGLKTAVLYKMRELAGSKKEKPKNVPLFVRKNIAASFQKSAVNILVKKVLRAAKVYNVNSIVLGGGVSANEHLRNELINESKSKNIELFLPEKKYCTDNAAMIASVAYYKWKYT